MTRVPRLGCIFLFILGGPLAVVLLMYGIAKLSGGSFPTDEIFFGSLAVPALAWLIIGIRELRRQTMVRQQQHLG